MPSASRARSSRTSLTASCMRYCPTGFVIQPTLSTPPSFSLSITVARSCTVAAPSARMNTDLSSRARSAWRTRSLQKVDLHVVLVELDRSRPAEIGRHGHVDRLRGHGRGLPRLRQVHLQALLHHRRGHHEDDEQHEHHVDERHDIDLGQRRRHPRAAPATRPVGAGCLMNFRHFEIPVIIFRLKGGSYTEMMNSQARITSDADAALRIPAARST